MAKRKFRIGDKITMKNGIPVGMGQLFNCDGVIADISNYDVTVKFNQNIGGHSGCAERDNKQHWYVLLKEIILIKPKAKARRTHVRYYPSMVTHMVGAH